jgi:hypothetical protein
MKRLVILIILCNPTLCAFARTIYVDANGTGDYPTIQAAIDDTNDGDVLVLSPGIYTGDGNRDINYNGKAITVRGATGNPDDVIIDCQGNVNETHRGFKFASREDANSILEGLTIINGYGPKNDMPGGYSHSRGGGIYCEDSDPTIQNCVIAYNSVSSNSSTYSALGGGIFNSESSPIIENCIIANNSASSNAYASNAMGGGIYNNWSSPTIKNCIISFNSATSYSAQSYTFGGGIHNRGWYSYTTIQNCIITSNSVFSHFASSEAFGGGIYNQGWYSFPTVQNCIIVDNSALHYGGGIFNSDNSLTVRNCTIIENSANKGSGIYNELYRFLTVLNCIVWSNSLSGTRFKVYYSDIQNGFTGVGNINLYPLFESDGYYLSANSPCINAGDPNYKAEPNETDLGGNPRINDGRIDMGCYEFYPNTQPVAIAGPNQTVYIRYGDVAEVMLDGSASYDDNNDVLSYYWSWSIESNNYEANGVSPTIELPVGEHIIELVVDDGIDYSQPDHVTIRVLPNAIPVAIAGPNQTVYICYGDVAEVMLDGSASYDDDNDMLSYYWSWIIDSNVYEANGVSPTIELPVGEHEIKLIVDDGIDYSEPDYVTINVLPPVECQLLLKKDTLRLGQGSRWLQTTLIFSQSIGEEDIDLTAAITIEPIGLEASTVRVQDRPNRSLSLKAVFDVEALLQSLTPADIEVSVVGKLKDARCFSGIDIIQILPPK